MQPYNHKKNNTMSNNKIEENIINAARTEFVKHGYECTSMSEIAARAGINRPTLHYYFRTKEKMFQAVFGDIIETFIPDMQSIAESFKGNLDGSLSFSSRKAWRKLSDGTWTIRIGLIT